MAEKRTSLKLTWLLLGLPPVIFLLGIVIASIYYGFQGQTDPGQISQSVANSMSPILLIIQIVLLALFLWVKRSSNLNWGSIGWKTLPTQRLWKEILIGAVPGAVLGLLYVFALSPLLTAVQKAVGDYVPAGKLLPSLRSGLLAFLAADVLMAPFVEENIYRGFALTRLSQRYSQPIAILISCLFFGLFHWAGGFWYILLVGGAAGGLFATLFARRGNIVAPYAAHLALNLVEFVFVLGMMR